MCIRDRSSPTLGQAAISTVERYFSQRRAVRHPSDDAWVSGSVKDCDQVARAQAPGLEVVNQGAGATAF
eukprot:7511027-Alexandrium_andersonii.AAC.1